MTVTTLDPSPLPFVAAPHRTFVGPLFRFWRTDSLKIPPELVVDPSFSRRVSSFGSCLPYLEKEGSLKSRGSLPRCNLHRSLFVSSPHPPSGYICVYKESVPSRVGPHFLSGRPRVGESCRVPSVDPGKSWTERCTETGDGPDPFSTGCSSPRQPGWTG